MRHITDLEWARTCEHPRCIPKTRRLYGAKAAGIRYEKSVAKAIPGAIRGQWFEFYDANGHGYCQTDVLVIGKANTLVIECKLTDTEQAYEQLSRLYLPVVSMAFERHVIGLVVVRHLTKTSPRARVHENIIEAISLGGGLVHWLGNSALV